MVTIGLHEPVAYNEPMPIEPTEEPFYTIREVAELLGMSRQRVHKLIQQDRIRAHRFGNVWMVAESAIKQIEAEERRVGRPSKKR